MMNSWIAFISYMVKCRLTLQQLAADLVVSKQHVEQYAVRHRTDRCAGRGRKKLQMASHREKARKSSGLMLLLLRACSIIVAAAHTGSGILDEIDFHEDARRRYEMLIPPAVESQERSSCSKPCTSAHKVKGNIQQCVQRRSGCYRQGLKLL
jgi:hypothetical protein